jgi:cell division protein FtsQ
MAQARRRTSTSVKHPVRLVRRTWLLGAVLILATGGAGVLLVQGSASAQGPLKFPLRYLKVEGPFLHVTAEQVRAIAGAYTTQGYFATDVRVIKQALQSLPWVYHATVRRVWPDVLHVAIVEQKAVARWGAQALINGDGRLFYPTADEFPQGLPRLDGPDSSVRPLLAQFGEMNVSLAPLGLRIVKLSMDDRRALDAVLENGVRLIIGRSDAESRVQRFARFYPAAERRLGDAFGAVDLRYTNGFVVRRAADRRRRGTSAVG